MRHSPTTSPAATRDGAAKGHRIGYARVSTVGQSLEEQHDKLTRADCSKIFEEKLSGKKRDRPELERMLEYVRAGDTLIITKLDRLARNTLHLHAIAEELERKVVKPIAAVPGVTYPLLIDAVGRCPLEDSGGPWGYMEMIDALRDPAHPRHAEVIEWPGRAFDPRALNREKLDQDVASLAKVLTTRRRGSVKPKPPTNRRKAAGDEWF